MKLKLTGSTFVALIIYLLTTLVKLIQFNPLEEVLMAGLKFAVLGFIFTIAISYTLELMNKPAEETAGKGKGEGKQESKSQNSTQPKGKAGKEYQKNNTTQDNGNAEANQETQQQNDTTEDSVNDEWDFDEDFSEMEPPVIEYEQNN